MARVLESPTLKRERGRISRGKVGKGDGDGDGNGDGNGNVLGEVGNEFETIYDFATSSCAAFDTK